MIRLNDILQRVQSYHPDPDLDVIKKAYVYSAKLHQGQLRNSGEPYLVHPLEVAGVLAELKLDEASIVTGLLHDTIEDTLATMEELTELFGPEIAQLVDGVTKLSKFSASASLSQEEKQAENFRKMIIAMAQDIRVILVKLADRTHNMRTLEHMKEEKQRRIAQETLDIYAPLANRLGISWIKTELEDLSLRYLKPHDYAELLEKLSKRRQEREQYIGDVVRLTEEKLKERNLHGLVSGRFKHLYSIYKKMKAQSIDFDQIHDVIAFRLLMPTIPSCYEALGLIHQLWKPVPGRFKDFIAIPKPNMYQSLHTTVIGPLSERVEVQIRTEEMHKIAEEGIAAHWAYKEGKSIVSKDDEKFAWLRQLMEWQQDLKDPKEFLETVKVDLFTDEVFVFTPKGDVKSLPRGATPVDFAFAIHSDIGSRCTGAKVNGKIVALRYKLKNGQPSGPSLQGLADLCQDQPGAAKNSLLHQAATAREESAARARAGGTRVQKVRDEFHADAQERRAQAAEQRAWLSHRGRHDGRAGVRQARASSADPAVDPGGEAGGVGGARGEGGGRSRGRLPLLDESTGVDPGDRDGEETGRSPESQRRSDRRRGRCPGAIRPLLQSRSRRSDRWVHHPRTGGHRPPRGMRKSTGD